MILGVDTGNATCGWALLDEGARRFVDLGVVVRKRDPGLPITIDRARRSMGQSQVLARHIRGCSTVVVEQLSFPPGGVAPAVSLALGWGLVVGLAAMLDPAPALLTISPQRWQQAIAGVSRPDYDDVAARAEYMLRQHPGAAAALDKILPEDRNHAIDAACLALIGAMDAGLCERVAA